MRETLLLIAGIMLACAGVAKAEAPTNAALAALVAPQPGNKACYARSYDAAHLRAHPGQRITAMTFLITVTAYDPKPADAKAPQDLVYYPFAMSVARRGDKRLLHTSGDCTSGDGIRCVVDCDGGSVTLDKTPPANTLIVRLTGDGIRMFHDCDDEEGVLVNAGVDDKVFRLDKVDLKSCQALIKQIED